MRAPVSRYGYLALAGALAPCLRGPAARQLARPARYVESAVVSDVYSSESSNKAGMGAYIMYIANYG